MWNFLIWPCNAHIHKYSFMYEKGRSEGRQTMAGRRHQNSKSIMATSCVIKVQILIWQAFKNIIEK